MASRTYYLLILTGIIFTVLCTVSTCYMFYTQQNQVAGVFLGIIDFVGIALFIKYLNQINSRIASFFNAVHNQDTSIQMPKNPGNRVISDIYEGMKKTIHIIQSVKMESQFREKLFMAMIEHSTTGFISIDEFGDFEIMNETARKLLGVEYTSNMDRMQKETPELFETLALLKPGQSRSCRISRSNFSTVVQVASARLIYKEKKLTLVSLLDIQKEIDARELESWQKLIRIMNHEIMNSIAPITSASKSLIKIFKRNDDVIQKEEITDKLIQDTVNGLEVIDTMSNGLIYFVSNYRKLSKIPEPVINEIEVKKWAHSLKQILLEYVNNSSTHLEITVKDGIHTFYGDEKLLNQVMINLVKNADEAPETSGIKNIKITLAPSLRNRIDIQVINNGIPIEKENLDKIFIPFFTTKAEGAGIGLYVSRQIINLHNGSLTVVSNESSGTIFSLSL